MKLLVQVCLCVCIVSADLNAGLDGKNKPTKSSNTLQNSYKSDQFYQTYPNELQGHGQPPPQPQPPSQYYQSIPPQHQQQPAMIIIAQPAYVPANLLYGNQHSSPQQRYQLIYQNNPGSYQQAPQGQLPPYFKYGQQQYQASPGYQQAPQGYQQAPQGYQQGPQGYQQAPQGYQQAPQGQKQVQVPQGHQLIAATPSQIQYIKLALQSFQAQQTQGPTQQNPQYPQYSQYENSYPQTFQQRPTYEDKQLENGPVYPLKQSAQNIYQSREPVQPVYQPKHALQNVYRTKEATPPVYQPKESLQNVYQAKESANTPKESAQNLYQSGDGIQEPYLKDSYEQLYQQAKELEEQIFHQPKEQSLQQTYQPKPQALQQTYQPKPQALQQVYQPSKQSLQQVYQPKKQTLKQVYQPKEIAYPKELYDSNPKDLASISHLAQLAAQQFLTNPSKPAPAIITGLENFTPDQQAAIKNQLSDYFDNKSGQNEVSKGASSRTPTTTGSGNQYSSRYSTPVLQKDFTPMIPKTEGSTEGPEATKSKYGK